MNKDIKYWVDISKYDLECAEVMFRSRRYIYVLFMCQQALEKILKANVIKVTKEFPPKIHNLTILAKQAKINLSEFDKKFLEKLNYYYIETRYPEEISKIKKGITKKLSADCLKMSKILWQTLKQNLK